MLRDEQALSVVIPESPSLLLAHTRLSIIDLAGGAQPMTDEIGRHWLSFNGELYNYRDLRRELESTGAHHFKTSSDTEVVLASLKRWGAEALSRFNGMFALAWWDAEARALLLARDPLGIKPLYYSSNARGVEFASELKAMDAARTAPIDDDLLRLHLALGFLPSPHTLRRGVSKLKPGHWVRFKCDGFGADQPQMPFFYRPATGTQELRGAIGDAVSRQMIADVPVGIFLSGGLDSTVIATHMARADADVQSFSIGFADDGSGHAVEDENQRAEAVAARLGIKHRSLLLGPQDCLAIAETAIGALDEPITSSSFIPQYLLARHAREHVKVVLAGQGADELFGGYARYRAARLWDLARRSPEWLSATLASVLRQTSNPKLKQLGVLLAARCPESAARAIYLREGMLELVGPTVLTTPNGPPLPHAGKSLAEQLVDWDRTHLLSDDLLLYGDRMTMVHALEMRVPFLDLDLVASVGGQTDRVSLLGNPKQLLRAAIPKGMPDDPLRKKKLGFVTPIRSWVDGAFKEWIYEIPGRLGIDYIVNSRTLDQWYEARRRSGTPLYERELWAVLCLRAAEFDGC